ncbi:MAG TPA: hypothetical protein ENI20_13490 [Bacteroides sp.]|nr:hypothetical protein [Bacteroides sp.]
MDKIKVLLIIVVVLASCTTLENRSKEQTLARVYDKNLYLSDIHDIFPENISRSDSIIILQNFVDKWVKKQLILQKAELNLTEVQKDVTLQLDEYRSSLLIYKYEQKLLEQKLDTIITPEEVRSYYDENPSNFSLDNHIVKCLFIKLPIDAPDLYRIRQLYRSEREEDFQELESYCYQYAVKYDYFNEDWITFESITRELPSEVRSPERYLRYNRYIEQQDSTHRYLVNLREFQLAGTPAPLPYMETRIRTIILNKRKVQFVNDLENNIYMDALNKGEFTIH